VYALGTDELINNSSSVMGATYFLGE